MTPRQVFRLMLRIVGLLILVHTLPRTIWTIMTSITFALEAYGSFSFHNYGEVTVGVVQFAVAVYLLTGPHWLVNLVVREAPGRCYECGYRLKGLPPRGNCPECGVAYAFHLPFDETAPPPGAPPRIADSPASVQSGGPSDIVDQGNRSSRPSGGPS